MTLKKALKKNMSFCYTRRRLGFIQYCLLSQVIKNQELKWSLKV